MAVLWISISSVISAFVVILSALIAAHTGQAKLIGAFLVGFVGSAAYITALYFKFIGVDDKSRSIIMNPFCSNGRVSKVKCLWYACMGGCIAVIFQFDVPNFVAIQSLILGATWPAVVAQFLSGRLASPTKEEDVGRELLSAVEKSTQNYPADSKLLEERIEKLKKNSKKK